MDRLWVLKFTSMFPIPQNSLSFFFTDEDVARRILTRHADAFAGEMQKPMAILVFEDLMGSQCLQSNFFPHCTLAEIGPHDLTWKEISQKLEASQKEISQKLEASQKAANLVKDMGFKAEEKG